MLRATNSMIHETHYWHEHNQCNPIHFDSLWYNLFATLQQIFEWIAHWVNLAYICVWKEATWMAPLQPGVDRSKGQNGCSALWLALVHFWPCGLHCCSGQTSVYRIQQVKCKTTKKSDKKIWSIQESCTMHFVLMLLAYMMHLQAQLWTCVEFGSNQVFRI